MVVGCLSVVVLLLVVLLLYGCGLFKCCCAAVGCSFTEWFCGCISVVALHAVGCFAAFTVWYWVILLFISLKVFNFLLLRAEYACCVGALIKT